MPEYFAFLSRWAVIYSKPDLLRNAKYPDQTLLDLCN